MKIEFYNAADTQGTIAKTILAGCYKFGHATLLRRGGATMTSVVEIQEPRIVVWDDFNGCVYGDQDTIGTVRQTFGANAPRNGFKIIEVYDEDT